MTTTQETAQRTGQRLIELDRILVSGENPRKHFDEDAMEELAASIERDGLLQPVLVRPIASDEEWPALKRAREAGELPAEDVLESGATLYELVSGERRYRAHQRLGRESIRAEVREMDHATAVRIRLIENVHREDLHELEEAAAFERMQEELGYDVEAIAEEVGKSTSYVYQRLKLLELAGPVQASFGEGAITAGHAIEIARLPTPDLQERALDACHVRSFGGQTDGTLSVRDLRDWIRRNTHLDLHAAPWKKDDAKLLPQAGSCTDCPKRTGNAADLWPDVEKGATCTDPECYRWKTVAYVEREADRLEDEGTDFVRVSSELMRVSGGDWLERMQDRGRAGPALTGEALGKRSYSWLDDDDDRCDHTVVGLVVDGGRVGERIDVCPAAECEVHHGGGTSGPDPEAERRREVQQRNARERDRRETLVDRRLAEALLERARARDLQLVDVLRVVLVRLWDELWVDNQKAAAGVLGLDGHSCSEVADWVADRRPPELAEALLVACLGEYFGGSTSARPPAAYRIRGHVLQDLLDTSTEEVEAAVREERDWLLPEDLIPGLRWVVPAEDDDDGVRRRPDVHHAADGDGVFCGNPPEEHEVRDAQPTGYRWRLCTKCQDHIVSVQTSAMEDFDGS